MRLSRGVSFCCFLVFSLCFFSVSASGKEGVAKGVVHLYQIHDSQCSPLLLLLDRAFSLSTDIRIDWHDATSIERSEVFRHITEGDVDILLTNDATLVDELEKKEWVRLRRTVMSNQLFLVGPEADPAGAFRLPLEEAFYRIADTASLFVSPLHGGWFTIVESELWKSAGVADPEALKGYISSGRNRLGAMMQAGDEGGYILTDPATFAAYEGALTAHPAPLKPISSRADGPSNHYFIVVIERGILGGQRVLNAEELCEWLVSDHAQKIISSYTLSGHHPFAPWSEGR